MPGPPSAACASPAPRRPPAPPHIPPGAARRLPSQVMSDSSAEVAAVLSDTTATEATDVRMPGATTMVAQRQQPTRSDQEDVRTAHTSGGRSTAPPTQGKKVKRKVAPPPTRAGRPPRQGVSTSERVTLRLTAQQARFLRDLGEGQIAEGVRRLMLSYETRQHAPVTPVLSDKTAIVSDKTPPPTTGATVVSDKTLNTADAAALAVLVATSVHEKPRTAARTVPPPRPKPPAPAMPASLIPSTDSADTLYSTVRAVPKPGSLGKPHSAHTATHHITTRHTASPRPPTESPPTGDADTPDHWWQDIPHPDDW